MVKEIKHFSHLHKLKLNDEYGIDKNCDACIRSILPPFYSCAQCEFFLHKSCTKLTKKNCNTHFINTPPPPKSFL